MSFQIRLATRADLGPIAALISSQNSEPTRVEDMERMERLRNPAYPFLRLVAVDSGGALLGTGNANSSPDSRPGEFFLRVRVWKEQQGKGVGSALYDRLETYVREQGGTNISSGVKDNDPSALAWCQRRGYTTRHHLFESTLSLHEWDPAPFLSDVERARTAGIRFTTLADEGDVDALLPAYYKFSVALVHEIPGMEDRPHYPYEAWLKELKEDPRWDPRLIILAADGDRWIAVSQISRQPSGGYYNNFTGVERAYRGQGLSMAIKVVALIKARELGAPWIRTNNHAVNKPMLATNQRLGYEPQPGYLQLTKRL